MKFLCADDDADDRLLIRAALMTLGADEVEFVRDGAELLASLGSGGSHAAPAALPDAVLLDLNMPGTDGFSTLLALKADPVLAEIPVVVLTGSQSTFDRIRSYRLGAVHHIVKPFSFGGLIEELRTVGSLGAEGAKPRLGRGRP